MCASYELDADPEALVRAFRVDDVQLDLPVDGWPATPLTRYPRQKGLIIALQRDPSKAPRRVLGAARFGLVPSFAKDPAVGNKLFNARAETLAERPVFRAAFQRRRCLVPVTAFFEWKPGPGGKQRYRIRAVEGALLALAGIWETFRLETGEKLISFAIVTTAANALIGALHSRMPALLPPSAQALWLTPDAEFDALRALLLPAPEDALEAVPG